MNKDPVRVFRAVVRRMLRAIRRSLLMFLNDEQYARYTYLRSFGRTLNLANPEYYSEKLQYLKLFGLPDEASVLADKLMVRDYVRERIGEKYLNKLQAVFASPASIRFSELEYPAVLKYNHASGFNIILKSCPQGVKAIHFRLKLWKWHYTDYSRSKRERQYKHITPTIICEKYLEDNSGSLRDYKVLCFSGKAKLIQVDEGRRGNHQRDIYDENWKKLPVRLSGVPNLQNPVEKPALLEELLRNASELSRGLIFCRVDFYLVDSSLIFGEITLHPNAGLSEFDNPKMSRQVASWIDLSSIQGVSNGS
jgi:hypothetical protein